MVIEVKGGEQIGINILRQLHSVLQNDPAQLAGLIVMHPPTERQRTNFNAFIADAGHYETTGTAYPRLQILTVEQILNGQRFRTPGLVGRGSPQANLPLPNA